MDQLNKIKLMFSSPDNLFKELKHEKGIGQAFGTVLIALIITISISIAVMSIMAQTNSLNLLNGYFLIAIIIPLVMIFMYPALILITLKLFKINAKYTEIFKAYAYGITPSILFSPIPLVNYVAQLYSLYLIISGVAILSFIPKKKAILPCILPGIVLLLLLAGAAFFFFRMLVF